MRNRGAPNQERVLTWDAENRLAAVTYTNRTVTGSGGGSLPTTCNGVPCKRVFLPLVMQQTPAERYSYDADGVRVRKESKTEVTRTIGPHFEVTVAITNSQVLTTTKYYDFGGQRIAVRQITPQTNTLSYLHGDHLGSTSVTTNNSGAQTSNVRYHAYGGQRSGNLFALPTDHTFTGQKLDKGSGLLYYGARYYDNTLGMFVSPDPLIPDPGNPQELNRYSYTRNNPLKYIDSDGHFAFVPLLIAGGVGALATSALDLGKQLVVDQKSIQDVNWAEVGGAAVGGFVSGATLGLAPAGASVLGLGLLGAAGGVAGSQAQALTQAGLEDLLGKNPQGSVIAEARTLGLLDTKTMVLSGGAGAVMGGLGGKFAGLIRSKLALPESASTVRISGEVPHIRWQLRLDQPGVWTAHMEGRVINMSADTFERVVRAMAMGGYELLEQTLDEAIQQGAIWVVEENTQP